ncbi:MAG TPA: PIG-L deacetylase family protein [Terriglobia bacterium]|nr:PIG-L deacetylase family protein [Terriglobia bacterium]
MMAQPTSVLAIFAHPDDAEFLCAGTLALLAERGAKVYIATMTAGDCGSTILSAAKISRIRRGEAERAAQLIGASYSCLGQKDLNIFYDQLTLGKVMETVRARNPSLVLTHSPVDYMVDHETTSRLCQTACFGAMAPNFRTGGRRKAKSLRAVPHLYYADPFGGRDILGNEIASGVFVDIRNTLSKKEQMLACHESQRAFLSAQQGISDTGVMMRSMAERAGKISGLGLAEGFRQHLGQGFPQGNLLAQLLGEMVHPARI